MTSAIEQAAKKRLDGWRTAPVTWDPTHGGKRPLVCWDDDKTYDLGDDPASSRFAEISRRMLSGRFYPPDVIEFYGDWLDQHRDMTPGDRVIQRARLFARSVHPGLWAMTEIFVAERSQESCSVGYVTTSRHFGRGIWRADLTRTDDQLTLRVRSTAGPGSFWFWIGLPVARSLMLRARRRAVEEFAKV